MPIQTCSLHLWQGPNTELCCCVGMVGMMSTSPHMLGLQLCTRISILTRGASACISVKRHGAGRKASCRSTSQYKSRFAHVQAIQTFMYTVAKAPSLCLKQSQAWAGGKLQWLLLPNTTQLWPPQAVSSSLGAPIEMADLAMLLLTPSLHRASECVKFTRTHDKSLNQ